MIPYSSTATDLIAQATQMEQGGFTIPTAASSTARSWPRR